MFQFIENEQIDILILSATYVDDIGSWCINYIIGTTDTTQDESGKIYVNKTKDRVVRRPLWKQTEGKHSPENVVKPVHIITICYDDLKILQVWLHILLSDSLYNGRLCMSSGVHWCFF